MDQESIAPPVPVLVHNPETRVVVGNALVNDEAPQIEHAYVLDPGVIGWGVAVPPDRSTYGLPERQSLAPGRSTLALFPSNLLLYPYESMPLSIPSVILDSWREDLPSNASSRDEYIPRFIGVYNPAQHLNNAAATEKKDNHANYDIGSVAEVTKILTRGSAVNVVVQGVRRFAIRGDNMIAGNRWNLVSEVTIIEDICGPFTPPWQGMGWRSSRPIGAVRKGKLTLDTLMGCSHLAWTANQYRMFDCEFLARRVLRLAHLLIVGGNESDDVVGHDSHDTTGTGSSCSSNASRSSSSAREVLGEAEWVKAYTCCADMEARDCMMTRLSFDIARLLPTSNAASEAHVKRDLLRTDSVVHRLRLEHQLLVRMHQSGKLGCAVCGFTVGCLQDLMVISPGSTTQGSFVNPNGHVHQIYKLSKLSNLAVLDDEPPTTFYSWFPGYAWQNISCAQCEHGLGWKFTRVAQQQQQHNHNNNSNDINNTNQASGGPLEFWGVTGCKLLT